MAMQTYHGADYREKPSEKPGEKLCFADRVRALRAHGLTDGADEWTDGLTDGTDGRTGRRTDGWTGGWADGRTGGRASPGFYHADVGNSLDRTPK